MARRIKTPIFFLFLGSSDEPDFRSTISAKIKAIEFLKKLFCIEGISGPASLTKLFITVKQKADATMQIIPLYLSGITEFFLFFKLSLLCNAVGLYLNFR